MHLPISIGTAVIVMSLVVLLFWIPLRELPGLGHDRATPCVVGLVADADARVSRRAGRVWAARAA